MAQREAEKVTLPGKLIQEMDERRGERSRSAEVELSLGSLYGRVREEPLPAASRTRARTRSRPGVGVPSDLATPEIPRPSEPNRVDPDGTVYVFDHEVNGMVVANKLGGSPGVTVEREFWETLPPAPRDPAAVSDEAIARASEILRGGRDA